MQIEAKNREGNGVTFEWDMPTNLAACVEKWGEDGVYDLAKRSAVIAVQAIARGKLTEGNDAAKAAADAWVPGQRSARTTASPLERAAKALEGMDADAIAALLAKVKEKQRALRG